MQKTKRFIVDVSYIENRPPSNRHGEEVERAVRAAIDNLFVAGDNKYLSDYSLWVDDANRDENTFSKNANNE